MARFTEGSVVDRPRTRARLGSAELASRYDLDNFLCERRRALREAKAAERNSLHHSGGNSEEAGTEVPDSSDVDPWRVYYEDIGYRPLSFSGSGSSDTESSTSPSEDPLVSIYRNIGYLSPLDDSTLRLLDQVLSDPNMGKTGGRINTQDVANFRIGLGERNVELEPCRDAHLHHINSLSPKKKKETKSERKRHALAWELDLKKTKDDPQEPVFQRTIMMSMIDRHRFIYDRTDNLRVLDFAVERTWKCPPMPSRALWEKNPRLLTQSKADLALAFRQYAIFRKENWRELPNAMRSVFCYEGEATGREVRVFHFMTIEGKNSDKGPDDTAALGQNLNNASQSLHNMYELFREAGKDHINVFFDKVRFFSAVSTSKGIKIRIHRACLTKEFRKPVQDGQVDEVPPAHSIVDGYPLQFVFDDFFEASATDFMRKKVVGIFEKIMVGYAIGELRGYLQKAAEAVEAKCLKYKSDNGRRLDHDIGYYLYGMPLPGQKNGDTTSVASQVNFSTQIAKQRLDELGIISQKPDNNQQESTQEPGPSMAESTASEVPNLITSRKRQRTS
ncbi:hypothetical protein NUW58_g4997 [Xylaria curta]|uniref:Uncharacterized protein n=1 Tax=Xylaria curta TaxID=42375 RepID=A0ACC1P6H8_9PEZI|nr:hypothetical protein NUW58_g4997 [Xylaria curta]